MVEDLKGTYYTDFRVRFFIQGSVLNPFQSFNVQDWTHVYPHFLRNLQYRCDISLGMTFEFCRVDNVQQQLYNTIKIGENNSNIICPL